ncbi:MAG: phosphoglycerate dehydrogenase [Alphaproteobacteria bacterium]|nr:phosphoglycerate dehydrogenase [Alphaproteobacteria bacterium]
MPKVLISDQLSSRAAAIFRERGVEVDEKVGLKPAELIACIGAYDGLAIRSATKVTADVLKAGKNLKVVGRAGIGVDNVDLAAATARGVVVMNTPFGNSITTAEHAVAMLMALARQLPAANASTHAGKWEKSRFMGVEVYGKTLGVIGCGNIGAIVADLALGLKMKVIAHDPYLSAERARALGVEKVDLDELFRRADFITLHTPLTEATRNVIRKDTIAKMKDGVRIVNCARGGLVVEEDLKAAIESGKVGGAALDVFLEEPAKKNVLFGLEQVIATPHLGASTSEAQENVALQIAEQMSDFLVQGAVVNALNMPSISGEDAPKLRPYLRLAEQVGSFVGQVGEPNMRSVRIDYEGAVADLNVKPLTAVVLEGLLRSLMDSVNMVNAPVVARERGIEVVETKNERSPEYHSLIRLSVKHESGETVVAGTLFANRAPRIVHINGIDIEAELSKDMLLVTNDDLPGFIGRLGTILGESRINIATFHLGRRAAGGEAIALVSVDDAVSESVLGKIRGLPLVNEAKTLRFT